MNLNILLFTVLIILFIWIICNYNTNTNTNNEELIQYEINFNKLFSHIPKSIKDKLFKISSNQKILKKLSEEKEYMGPSGLSVYPNKLAQFIDGSMIGLGQYEESVVKYKKPNTIILNQLETYYDEILNNYP